MYLPSSLPSLSHWSKCSPQGISSGASSSLFDGCLEATSCSMAFPLSPEVVEESETPDMWLASLAV